MQISANLHTTASDAGSLAPPETSSQVSSSTYSGPERHRPPEVGEIVDYRVLRVNVEGKAWLRGYAIHWVVLDQAGNALRWGDGPAAPVGATHGDLTESMRAYNQAIHKPILDGVTGRPIEGPIIRRVPEPQKS